MTMKSCLQLSLLGIGLSLVFSIVDGFGVASSQSFGADTASRVLNNLLLILEELTPKLPYNWTSWSKSKHICKLHWQSIPLIKHSSISLSSKWNIYLSVNPPETTRWSTLNIKKSWMLLLLKSDGLVVSILIK